MRQNPYKIVSTVVPLRSTKQPRPYAVRRISGKEYVTPVESDMLKVTKPKLVFTLQALVVTTSW